MAVRSRSRYKDPVQLGYRTTFYKLDGTVKKNFDFGSPSNSYVYETCIDETMPRPYTVDHSLAIEKTVVRPSVITGKTKGLENSTWKDEEYVAFRFTPYSAQDYQSSLQFTAFNSSYYKTLALANASPYKSSLNLPLFLFELRELPSMIRQLGRVLAKQVRATDVAGGYLAYSFGWAPLVSDLLKLFDLSKDIENRKAYFRRLEKGTHVRRSLGTHTVRDTTLNTSTLLSYAFPKTMAQVHGNLTETQKVWFTLNAKLRQPLNMSPSDLHSLSRNQIYGLRFNPSDLWDAIPWSWLIDYFTNIGDMLEASRALVGMDVTRVNVMCTSKIIVSYEPKNVFAGLHMQPGFVYKTRKARYPFKNATPVPSFAPFLTNHQYGILGSLATVKALKASGAK